MNTYTGFLKRHPTTAVGGALLLLLFLVALCAPWLGTVDPTALSPIHRTRSPNAQFWFGTDLLGRDVYSRVIYGARVSLIVGFTVAALSTVIGVLIGGAVVTESVFAIPGLGRLTVDAILRRDYPVIQGVVLMFSMVYVLVNLLIDLTYTLVDPRIRY